MFPTVSVSSPVLVNITKFLLPVVKSFNYSEEYYPKAKAVLIPISWSRCHKGCPYDGFDVAYFQRNDELTRYFGSFIPA